jgi:hypothetical protein
MARLNNDDLKQMNRSYFQSLSQERLVEVADNLHQLATDLWEKQQQNSENSSQPPSLDNPYTSKSTTQESAQSSESESAAAKSEQKQIDESSRKSNHQKSHRKPGKQRGAKGFGRKQPLKAEGIIPHYPRVCSACNQDLSEHIGSRSKEELSHLVQSAFVGWLVTDGYAAYRSHPKRQRCLAHLIRKAVAITGAINQKARKFVAGVPPVEDIEQEAAQIGQWILDDLRELIAKIAIASENNRLIRKILAGLRRVCHLGKLADQTKLQALAKEILNDWDAVVAFVNHPELPPTNNEAQRTCPHVRALCHAVIARNIGFGTRTREGSLAYSSLLSVIETCRLREINPWTYIASVLANARQGLSPPPFPVGS